MKNLMVPRMAILMAEAESEGGGSTSVTQELSATQADTQPTEGVPAATGGRGETAAEVTQEAAVQESAAKPYLGKEKATEGEGEKPIEQAGEKPAVDEKAYLDGVKANKEILGDGTDMQFDEGLLKSVIPVCQKHNISVEAANEMANAFAKAQIDASRVMLKERCDRFQKMNKDAQEKYDERGFEQINRGIDKFFKPGGAMNYTIRNSELGADPEFLALMHYLGETEKEDHVDGVASSAGGSNGDARGYSGISGIWK